MLAPIVVTSTPPIPSPAHCFSASGFVRHSNGDPAANYTVIMVARGRFSPSLGWERLLSRCGRPEDWSGPVAITDSNGRFRVSPCACVEPDSIAVAVVLPDTMIVGDPIRRRSLSRYETDVDDSYTEDGFLCDDTVKSSYVDYYTYQHVDSIIVPVP